MTRIGSPFAFDADGKRVKIKSFASLLVFSKEVSTPKVWLILSFSIEVAVNSSDKKIIPVVQVG